MAANVDSRTPYIRTTLLVFWTQVFRIDLQFSAKADNFSV